MPTRFSRRHFFFGSLLAGAIPAGGFAGVPSLKRAGFKSPNQKLNIACIGAGGRAPTNIAGCAPTENIVAFADVDDATAAPTYILYPKAARYRDFRRMLDKEGGSIDAVIVTTPDHTHTVAAMACMERGKHVYVEKPLARTIWEVRLLAEAALKYGVATQMGNQGYSSDGTPANPPAGIAPASSEPKKKCLRENRVGICSSSVQPPRRLRLRFRVSQIEVRYG
jgi:hypothetical protein